jgi:pyruvate dehydrogenase E2 component (dihydrolipoamide acetyltransferase)
MFPVLTNVCVIGQEGESVEEFRPKQDGEEAAAVQEELRLPQHLRQHRPLKPHRLLKTAPTEKLIRQCSLQMLKILKYHPGQEILAERLGVDVRYAKPTGPYGRIIEQDIIAARDAGHMMTPAAQAAAAAGIPGGVVRHRFGRQSHHPGSGPDSCSEQQVRPQCSLKCLLKTGWYLNPAYDEVKVPNIRKVIAKAMHQSLATTAQLTLNSSFDATEILEYRKKLKEAQERMGLANITINDMILFAVSRTLPKYKDLNAHFLDDTVRYFHNVNLGMAVDTERGLMVPTIFHADKLSLNEIAVRSKKLAVECQTGSINPDFLQKRQLYSNQLRHPRILKALHLF